MKRLLAVFVALLLGCASGDGSSAGGGSPGSCHGSGENADSACLFVAHRLESLGCAVGTCNASCPGSDVICSADIADCEAAAGNAATCADAIAQCNAVLVCRPLD